MFDEKEKKELEQDLNNKETTNEEEVQINVTRKRKRFDDFKIRYKKDKKKYLVTLSAILAMVAMTMGSSYAYLTYVSQTDNTVVINAGTLALTFQNEENVISILNAVPMKDQVGLEQEEEYSFDVKNNGSIPAIYKITLDNTCESGNGLDLCIPDEYIKVGIKVGNNDYKVVERNDKSEYVIETGSLQPNKSQSYKMKIWLAHSTPNTYNAQNNQSIAYKGKLGLTYEQGQQNDFLLTLKKLANTNQTINFKNAPSDTNGNGINILEGTENDTNPIYFYRGFDTEGKHVVSNNNVLFGGFCWKIVRTTDTGGIKIVYNGEPTVEGKCTNTTGEATRISTSAFNSSYNSPAYNGYMYGTVYQYKNGAATEGSLFGSSFTYLDGTYTLTNTASAADSTHHYTCNNTTGTCSTIRYYYYIKGSYDYYYIELTNGKSVSDAIEEMQTNTTDSTIKTVIDNWYETNLASYEEYLEDTVWCNDRSIYQLNGWNPEGGDLTQYLYYKGYERNISTYKPSVVCPNKNDAFTVSDTIKGNGKLKHPVALLTADELTMAGSGNLGYSTSSYLNTSQIWWWSLSPYYFYYYGAYGFNFTSSGNLSSLDVRSSRGVRPAVSLAPGTSFSSGDGSADNPYKIA